MTKDEERWIKIGKATEKAVLDAFRAQHDGELATDVSIIVTDARHQQGLNPEQDDGP